MGFNVKTATIIDSWTAPETVTDIEGGGGGSMMPQQTNILSCAPAPPPVDGWTAPEAETDDY